MTFSEAGGEATVSASSTLNGSSTLLDSVENNLPFRAVILELKNKWRNMKQRIHPFHKDEIMNVSLK